MPHHTFRTRRTDRKAFTIVELLVVMSIIVLLVAILLPSMRAARETARLAVCMSQLKQLHHLEMAYAADNYQSLCHVNSYLKEKTNWPGAGAWPHVPDICRSSIFVTQGYMPEASIGIFLCPSDDGYREDHPELAGYWYQYVRPAIFSYTRNAELQRYAPYPHVAKTKYPAKATLLAEENETAPMNDGKFYANRWDLMTGRHNGRCGMLFFDGHVDYIDSEEYNYQSYQWRRMTYLDPGRS